MPNDVEVRWDRLTAPALREAVKDQTVIIIPLGATEQHGPHLPVQVDWRSAYEISLRAARLTTSPPMHVMRNPKKATFPHCPGETHT